MVRDATHRITGDSLANEMGFTLCFIDIQNGKRDASLDDGRRHTPAGSYL
jgi:hypothetical protein